MPIHAMPGQLSQIQFKEKSHQGSKCICKLRGYQFETLDTISVSFALNSVKTMGTYRSSQV
jgi:hypothetical protein